MKRTYQPKKQTEKKFMNLKQEWLQKVAKEFLHAVEIKAEQKLLLNWVKYA